ncbi:alanine-glyoxylate transaminase / serine-glyoxylate transaminase / serine-pyruvate transaminase [Noviherbaspirillum humi]|uniref:Alanine-glyoxylate transaminase / serine-glyoxylate transaminase / serine-pyruvate transaminase n=1 Tax=Noviherbaspirillum humi TaxID=1688639 RepID=A0A239LHF8_9BURK|nr:aminotransferase class V-fold PLP-dependent enzyme [Noviherbaspirillum humi]SNT29901.1 alanine-glyoxylate transaminase / serine-glyoxylate transaminase / serine-pyruvate transaminase [Noviherbaspirillum humi]
MLKLNSHPSGRHFLQIPGPSTVPDRILRAMDYPTIDHRGPEFQALGKKVLADIKKVFQTQSPVVIYPSSGTGAWEAALVNTLSPGDHVLMYETGHFATLWKKLAERLSLKPEFIQGDWRHGADAAQIEARLAEDTGHSIKAVCVVHNETSTGVTSNIAAVRRAIDNARHPALLLVDTISSLGSIDYRHDEWGVDVTISGSQKGLMLPPGLSFNAVSEKALAASKQAKLPRAFWAWDEIIAANQNGFWPYTPATNLLYGLSEACDMLFEEGLSNVFARHQRHALATREAVQAWGLEVLCQNPAEYSGVLTAVVMPKDANGQHHSADALRKVILNHFNMSLGQGLGKLSGWVFRIGHLGDFNDLTLCGTLSGVEMGLDLAKVPHQRGGVLAALSSLAHSAKVPLAQAA